MLVVDRSVSSRPFRIKAHSRLLLHLGVLFAVAALAGCSNGNGTASSSSAPVLNVPATTSAAISSVTNFGDSITCAYYASPANGSGLVYSTNGYAGLLDTAIGKSAQNLCRPGDEAADMARLWVYPATKPALGASQLYTVLIGTNDAHVCGASAGCLTNYLETLSASLAWLATPSSDKILGSDLMQKSGTWTGDFGFGLAATGPGATLSFPVQQTVAGRSLYLAYRVADLVASSIGTAVVSVDGRQVASLNGNPTTGHVLLTPNGTIDSVFLLTVPLGAVGTHQVSLTTTSEPTAFFSFLWAGVPSGNYATVSGAPRVVLGGVPITTSSQINQNVAVYNQQLQQLVANLTANGLNIVIAPTATALDGTDDMADAVHPNNAGHAKLAAAFANTL